LRLTVAQVPIEDQSNEIRALAPLVLKRRAEALEGSLITADVMHCQQRSARFVTRREAGVGCQFGLKGIQEGNGERAQARLPQRCFSL
jgi:predicted transposase YbfD/YdcC